MYTLQHVSASYAIIIYTHLRMWYQFILHSIAIWEKCDPQT
jgi:hypothetical protein